MDLKPEMIQLLPTFYGLENENPYVHIKEFERWLQPSTINMVHQMRSSLNFSLFRLKIKQKTGCTRWDPVRLEHGVKWLKLSSVNIFPIIKIVFWWNKFLHSLKKTVKSYTKHGSDTKSYKLLPPSWLWELANSEFFMGD